MKTSLRARWIIARHVLFPLACFGAFVAFAIFAVERYPLYAGVAAIILVLVGAVDVRRRKTRDLSRGWRCRRHGRDAFYYEELIDGVWERIAIDGEMLVGKPRHVFYLPTEEEWRRLPDWARHRRKEILERMQCDYPEPDYAYKNG